tara:strand:+ start:435 stop:608 length:174 start_codon:yes stop_codon:yes gene_type:complete
VDSDFAAVDVGVDLFLLGSVLRDNKLFSLIVRHKVEIEISLSNLRDKTESIVLWVGE